MAQERLKELLSIAREEIKDVLKMSEPLRGRREELLDKIRPFEEELREVNAKLKVIEQPRLGQLRAEIDAMEQALGITGLRECCRDLGNRELVERKDVTGGNVTVTRCKECGRNHHELEAHPLNVGVEGSPT